MSYAKSTTTHPIKESYETDLEIQSPPVEANKSKSSNAFTEGDIVWHDSKRWPAWPSIVNKVYGNTHLSIIWLPATEYLNASGSSVTKPGSRFSDGVKDERDHLNQLEHFTARLKGHRVPIQRVLPFMNHFDQFKSPDFKFNAETRSIFDSAKSKAVVLLKSKVKGKMLLTPKNLLSPIQIKSDQIVRSPKSPYVIDSFLGGFNAGTKRELATDNIDLDGEEITNALESDIPMPKLAKRENDRKDAKTIARAIKRSEKLAKFIKTDKTVKTYLKQVATGELVDPIHVQFVERRIKFKTASVNYGPMRYENNCIEECLFYLKAVFDEQFKRTLHWSFSTDYVLRVMMPLAVIQALIKVENMSNDQARDALEKKQLI